MSIRIGVYDFFSFTIPGIIYLIFLTLVYSLIDGRAIEITELAGHISNLFDSAFVGLVVSGIAAYLAGMVFDSIALSWARLFGKRDPAEWAFERFKKHNNNIEVHFTPGNWQVLLASVRAKNYDVATMADKYQATHVMLRNVSLGMLLLGLLSIVKAVQSGEWVTHLVLCFFLIFISIVCVRKAIVYSMWAYAFIYESFVAQTKNLQHLVTND